MTDTELIAQQAREIAELEAEVKQFRENARKVINKIYRIGGPLNDNNLNYNSKQMFIFHEIAGLMGD